MNGHMKLVVTTAIMTAMVATFYSGWLSCMTAVAAHLIVAVLAFYYSMQWTLICGKNYKPKVAHNQDNAINTIIKKMLVRF